MSIRTYKNDRGMTASTDGTRWWAGAETDEASISIGELQPVSTLFSDVDGGVSCATVAKARAVFISALRKTAPTVAPNDDVERTYLRIAWDDAVKFAESHMVFGVGVPVFDTKMLLVGTADALCKDMWGTTYSYCYAPEGFAYRGEVNAVVRMLQRGFPIDAEDDPLGTYTLRELSRALLAVVNRDNTEWYAKKREQF
jgi:hypothetical protein